MSVLFNRIWHDWLRQPYKLSKVIDTGEGAPVILLHGLGRTAQVWEKLVPLLAHERLRIIGFDLLGFGSSPKPDISYTLDEHAKAVIASLEKLRLKQPSIIIGHSMGCLVAVRVARLRPDLVRHLVLYEMPLYKGLPEQRRYQVRTNLYLSFYEKVIKYQPTFNPETARIAERLARKIVGFETTPETWQPFVRSLKNSIIEQTTAEDIPHLKMPMDVIYGTYDMLVIRGKKQEVFGKDSSLITAHSVRARHAISAKASHFIVKRVQAAQEKDA